VRLPLAGLQLSDSQAFTASRTFISPSGSDQSANSHPAGSNSGRYSASRSRPQLDEAVYERIAAHKRDEETFPEAIDWLIGGDSLREFAGGYSAETADRHRELLADAEAKAAEDRRERLQRL